MNTTRSQAALADMLALIDKHVPDRAAFHDIAHAINEYRAACIDEVGASMREMVAKKLGVAP